MLIEHSLLLLLYLLARRTRSGLDQRYDAIGGVVVHARAERLRNETQRNVRAGADDERGDVERLLLAINLGLRRTDMQRDGVVVPLRVDRTVLVHDRSPKLLEYAA